jgi:subtilisin family serine protease
MGGLFASRGGLLAMCCLAICVAHADGQCTREALPPGKVPKELAPLISQIDEGRFAHTLCKKWASLVLNVDVAAVEAVKGADPIPGAPWTVMFVPDTLQCDGSDCSVRGRGDIKFQVISAEPRVNTANVVLSPNRIGLLIADSRVRYVAPNCSAFPDPSKFAPAPAAVPVAAVIAPTSEAEPACEESTQWGLSDACIPASRANATSAKIVAVLDDGIDCLHPSLVGRIEGNPTEPIESRQCKYSSGKNYVYPELPPDHCDNGDELSCDTHGTAVAGIIASGAREAPGVDPGARLLSMRVLYGNSDLDFVMPWTTVATAILDSAKRAQILNISANWYVNYPELAAAIDQVTADGKHLIVAATRTSLGLPEYPAAFTKCNDAVVGASHVLRSREPGHPYYWGSPKASMDPAYLVAPGVSVLTSYSDQQTINPGQTSDAEYDEQTGSSFAAPHVTGAASLIWSTREFENCSAVGVREILECSARLTLIGEKQDLRKRLHVGCVFGQRDLPICRGARRCIESAKAQFCGS